MTPPDTPLPALPTAAPSGLRAGRRVRPPGLRRWQRHALWMLLLSALLHMALLTALLFVHRRAQEAAVAPSFDVLFEPPGTEVGKAAETKPSEIPAPASPPAPAPPPTPSAPTPAPPAPTTPAPTPPAPMSPTPPVQMPTTTAPPPTVPPPQPTT